MKEIRTTKLVEQTTVEFIADDGKKFVGENAERECSAYERRLNQEKVKNEFNKVKHIKVDFPFLNWFRDCAEILLVKLRNDDDYFRLIDYLVAVENFHDADIDITKPTSYPQQYNIILEECYCCNYVGDLSNQFLTVLNAFNEIEML